MTLDRSLPELFAEQAGLRSEAPAVSDVECVLSYEEVDRRSNRIARLLAGRGIGPGDRVGVCLHRSAGVVTTILGVLKSGAAYVPLDPINPDERLHLILEDAAPALVLTESDLAPRIASHAQVLELDRDPTVDGLDDAAFSSPATADSLAYVIYTSGTTGRPKGVMVAHRNVVELMGSAQALFDLGPGDSWTMFHSYAFDVSVFETWGALGFGGQIYVPSADMVRSPDAFYDVLADRGVTVLCQTPSAFNQIMGVEERVGARELALRLIVLGGEAMDPSRFEGWFDRHGDQTPAIINMYGTTETTVVAMHRHITRADLHRGISDSPIGVPLPHLDILLLDANGHPVPEGEAGEIHIVGDRFLGYLNRPDETSDRFMPAPGDRMMYRTGDLGEPIGAGDMVYRGRNDDQVQIRGFRVELGEIEAALNALPFVHEGVVRWFASESYDGRLVAYVVPGDGFTLERLREALGGRLPSYMIPNAFVELDELPLTPNDKVDRDALPDPLEEARAGGQPAAAGAAHAEDEVFAGVRSIWCELLEHESVHATTDFFEAGGHSLMAVEVMIRVRDEFHVDMPLGAMFEHTVLGALADAVRSLRAEATKQVADATPVGVEEFEF